MTKGEMTSKYAAGERTCPISDPLPAHRTWTGARYRFCMKPECVAIVKARKVGRYIGPNEHKCEETDCDNFVPEGQYRLQPFSLICPAECWGRSVKTNLILKCSCRCGQDVLRLSKRKTATGLVFLSPTHMENYFRHRYFAACCG
jgi:integrase/recombinase XerC